MSSSSETNHDVKGAPTLDISQNNTPTSVDLSTTQCKLTPTQPLPNIQPHVLPLRPQQPLHLLPQHLKSLHPRFNFPHLSYLSHYLSFLPFPHKPQNMYLASNSKTAPENDDETQKRDITEIKSSSSEFIKQRLNFILSQNRFLLYQGTQPNPLNVYNLPTTTLATPWNNNKNNPNLDKPTEPPNSTSEATANNKIIYTNYYQNSASHMGNNYGIIDVRRKNATRESTSTLKAWLYEHMKNPYPTKGEKIMLAIITRMTLTQVSTWFANARRRLKKENKMIWFPAKKMNKLSDKSDDDDDDYDDRNSNDFFGDNDENEGDYGRLSIDENVYGSDDGIYNRNKSFYESTSVHDKDNIKRSSDGCIYNDKHNEEVAQRIKNKIPLSVVMEEENYSNKCCEGHEQNQCNIKVFIKKNSFDGVEQCENQEKLQTNQENKKTSKMNLHNAYDTKTTKPLLNNPAFHAKAPNLCSFKEKHKNLNKNYTLDFKYKKNNFQKDIKNNKKENCKNEKMMHEEEELYTKSHRPNSFISACANVTECKSEGNKSTDLSRNHALEPECKKAKIWSIVDVIN